MNLPKIISDLLNAQSVFDSNAYTNCFSENAIVLDEGNTYNGKADIKKWNDETNAQYRITMEPIKLKTDDDRIVLTAKISGNFDGSPAVLKYHIRIKDELIEQMEISL